VNKTNNQWYPYEVFGSYFKLEDGRLIACPMNIDGSRDGDDGSYEIDWERGLEPEDEPKMKQIVAELQEKE